LATTGTNILDKENKVKESLQTRANIYQCRILVRNEIRELARGADDLETVRKLVLGRNAS